MNTCASSVIIPVCVCVVLPVLIVAIIALTRRNADNRRAQVLLRAIDAASNGPHPIDIGALVKALDRGRGWRSDRTPAHLLYARLQRGCIYTGIGVCMLIYGALSHDCEWAWYSMTAVFLPVGAGYLITYFASRKRVLAREDKEEAEG